jgi:acetyl/propionyl-CoA carboxylase alpha subunit
VQRRHQKVIEEAPAPAISDGLRAQLHASALAAAGVIGYTSAGTVEFLVDGDQGYFLTVALVCAVVIARRDDGEGPLPTP